MKVNYLQTSKSVTALQLYNMLTMFLEIFCKIIKCTKDDTCYHWLFTLDKKMRVPYTLNQTIRLVKL